MDPLIGVAAELYPDIVRLVARDGSGSLETQVSKAVTDVTSARTPQDAKIKLDQDASTMSALRDRLTQIAFQAYRSQAEVHETNQMLSILTKLEKPAVWAPTVISYIVTVGFLVIIVLLMNGTLKPAVATDNGQVNVIQLINVCIGALATAFATVVNFWLGSSLGSRNKDDAIAQSSAVAHAKALSESTAGGESKGAGGVFGTADNGAPAPGSDAPAPGVASRALANQS
jgi:hypothetical protein